MRIIVLYTWTDEPASFPEVTKRDWSSTWRSASSTCSVVRHVWFKCRIGPLDMILGTGMNASASCSPVPSRRSPGRVIGNDRMHRQRSTDVRKRTFLRTHTDLDAFRDTSMYFCAYVHDLRMRRKCGQRRRVRKRTLTRPWTRLQAYTQLPWWTRTLPCQHL